MADDYENCSDDDDETMTTTTTTFCLIRCCCCQVGTRWGECALIDPAGKKHGAPTDEERHAGDLGNITAGADGVAKVDITDVQIPLDGPNTIVGRAVVCHELVRCASASARPSCLTSPARLFTWKGTA